MNILNTVQSDIKIILVNVQMNPTLYAHFFRFVHEPLDSPSYIYSLVSVFFLFSPLFSERTKILTFTSFCNDILITVLYRVLKIKINLVKLKFWTAISSHQVMGMSLSKGCFMF